VELQCDVAMHCGKEEVVTSNERLSCGRKEEKSTKEKRRNKEARRRHITKKNGCMLKRTSLELK
jgi:hypothetical protein